MPIAYITDRTRRLITETWVGDIALADLTEHWNRLLDDPESLAIRRTLVDLRQAAPRFSAVEIETAVQTIVIPRLKGRDWVTAIVVQSVAQFRVTERYQAVAKLYSNDCVYSSVDEATAWLVRQDLWSGA